MSIDYNYVNTVSYCQNMVNSKYESYRINPNDTHHHILSESITSHIYAISDAVSNSSTSNSVKSNYLKECAVKYKPFLTKCEGLDTNDIKKMSNKEIKNIFNKNGSYDNVYNYDSYYNYDLNNYSNYTTYSYDGTKSY